MKKEYWQLIALFCLVLTVRLIFAFAQPNFTYESYFHLKQVEHITQTGLPLYEDPLSYGGRSLLFLPGYHYLIAFFDLFLPLEIAAKIISNVLISLILLLVYFISKKITHHHYSSLFAAIFSGFLPILWQTNSLSPYDLFLPLTLLSIYFLMSLNKKKNTYWYIGTVLLLSLTSSATALLIIGLLFYLLLSYIEKKKIEMEEIELTIFSLFLFIWVQLLFFKEILFREGYKVIWENIPPQILSVYFPKTSIFQSLILIGIVPLILGIYTTYKSLFQEKNRNIFFLFSLAISIILLFTLNLVRVKITLMFLGLIVTIIFAHFYLNARNYLNRTKLTRLKKYSPLILILIIGLTSIWPSINQALSQDAPSTEEIAAFMWIKEYTPPDSTILTTLEEGYLVNYVSQRKNFMDGHFYLIPDTKKRFDHLNDLYNTPYQTQAINILNQYHINYIFFSPKAKEEYEIKTIGYLDEKCFKRVFDGTVKIYQSRCQLKLTNI